MSKENALHRLIFSSKIYNSTLKEKKIKSTSKIEIETYPGSIEIGNHIFQGKLTLSGHTIDLRDKLPWEIRATREWNKEFHSFFWLHHLRASNTIAASRFSQTIIKKWIMEFNNWNELTWHISLIAMRIESWVLNYNFIIKDADQKFIDIFFDSIQKQSKHLLRWNTLNNNNIDYLQTRLSLYLWGVLKNKKKFSQKAVKLINIQIEKNFKDKNLFDCSNATEALTLLRILSLLKIINHDAERIERLITDYTQMLKDEASLSREKMSKINLIEIINNVAEDFKQDLKNQNKNIQIKIKDKISSKNGKYILGIENRLEQVIANLLDNSISFSQDNQKIEISIEETTKNLVMKIKDEGPGFSETSPQKIFKRFYSNRPKSFGKHSGLGLNIVKNIVELHKGTIAASNRLNTKGAQVEVLLPKFS